MVGSKQDRAPQGSLVADDGGFQTSRRKHRADQIHHIWLKHKEIQVDFHLSVTAVTITEALPHKG